MQWLDVLKTGYIHVAGTQYNVSHLLSSSFSIAIPASQAYAAVVVTIIVSYSSHCVAFGADPGEKIDFLQLGEDRLIYDHRGNARAFCFRRHRWSLNLPSTVHSLLCQPCHFTGYHNWLVLEGIDDQGGKVEYEIYFTLRRDATPGVLNMYIESAYVRDLGRAAAGRPKSRNGTMRFFVIAGKVLRGEAVRNPSHNKR